MKLRGYQVQAIQQLREGFRQGHLRQMLALATGAGKTVVASHMIHSASKNGRKSLFIVDRIELVDQAVRHFSEMGLRVGVMQGEMTYYTCHDEVVVASIQTLRRRYAPPSGLVIIDEAHVLHQAHIDLMTFWNAVSFIGLSATPLRKDLGKYFTNLVRGPSVRELTESGALVQVKAYCPSEHQLETALKEVSIVRGDFDKQQLSQTLSQKTLIGDVVSTWKAKSEGRKTLCFAVDVAHSKSIVDEFICHGIPAAHVDGYGEKSERDDIIQAFRIGEYQVLSSVNVLGIGFDMPTVSCGILARPTISESLHIQQVGRLIRTATGKDNAIVLDHAGNCTRFGLPIHFMVPELSENNRKNSRQKRKQRKMASCTECGFLLESGQQTCPDCVLIVQEGRLM